MANDHTRAKTQASERPSVLSTLPKELPLDFLKLITEQFSTERILEEGAFGVTYKGILPDGDVIAVKKLAENGPLSKDKAFTNEVQNIMALHHENIVKMVGFCHEGQRKVVLNNGRYIVADIVESLICYEYLPMGSLHDTLFGHTRFDWSTRFKIIKGICEGLMFIHAINIVHMDLKPENIWLTDKMEAKIVNFGLSRLFGEEQTRMNTQNVVGSMGYIAPEYLYRGEISAQADIYSLGLMIMEITTGEKNGPVDLEPSARGYIEKVRKNWTADQIASNYSSLHAEDLQQVHACIEIGLQCVEIDRRKRPSIQNIVDKLNARMTTYES